MSGRRTFAHGPSGGWSAVALHLEAAETTQEGFYLTIFPDGRSPQVVFLRPPQLEHLIDLAAQSNTTDAELWDVVAKVPLEPLLPNRSLAARLRALLVDQATGLRDALRAQADKRTAAAPADPGGDEPPTSDDI